MSATLPRIAVCVVTFNSRDLIRDLVDSLPAGAADTEWELIVADNDSSDDTVAELERWAPDATVVATGGNLGYAAGVNAAVRAAGERDAYLVLNADVRLAPGCLRRLYDSLGPGVGIAVPKLLDARGELIWSMRRAPSVPRAWADALLGAERAGRVPVLGEVVTDPDCYRDARPTDWAEGSTQLVSAACWRTCGEWDESFFLYSEEAEFDLRAGDLGFQVLYQPEATATHLEGGSAGSPELWSLVMVNRVRLYRRRHGLAPTTLFWAAAVVREAGRAAMGKPTSRRAIRDLVRPSRMRQQPGPDWLLG